MSKRTPGPYVGDLLATADVLVGQTGSATLRQACMRRAVSSAYYAVFHALCATCSDELVGWSRSQLLPPIYRSLDHGAVARKLKSKEAAQIDRRVERLGLLFAGLQEQRHTADYAPPAAIFSRTQTCLLIDDARDAISLIENLDAKARLELAILLVACQRPA